MAYFSWIAAEQELSSADLTTIVQAIDPNDQDELLWPVLFPRQDVGSVKISTITQIVPTRFVSDRREWNARGRLIPQEFPGTAELEMVPIEDFFKMGEREVQALVEQLRGNMEQFRREVKTNVPERTRELAMANLRRIEVDSINAWTTGQITARNPVTGSTYTASYNMDATRYQVAGAAWTGGVGGTAYQSLLTWLQAGIDRGIQIGGVMGRLSTRNAIVSSAPNTRYPFQDTPGAIAPLLKDVEARIQDELGIEFQFFLNEQTVDIFPTGGIATVNTKKWPTQTLAVVPSSGVIGYNAFAPVARAYDISQAQPEAEIDVNGMTVYVGSANEGRDLNVECQVNALPVPVERNVWVINTGV